MNNLNKNIALTLVLCSIVASIWYLESKKPPINSVGSDDIILNSNNTENEISVPQTNAKSSTTAETTVSAQKIISDRSSIRAKKATEYPRAKELVDPQGFINSAPFKLADIVGKKVVLIDFWTYSCINCVRTIPYLNAWYEKYKDLGLEIVGVHSPEFDFEKNYDNVLKAVQQLGIKYPVVLDSNHETWDAYQNLYWPREYLIDIDGFIVHDQIGEGSYSDTEQAIQQALRERDSALGLMIPIPSSIVNPSDVITMDQSKVQSPETYFGSARNQYLSNGQQNVSGSQTLSLPDNFQPNSLYLDGTWNFEDQYAENTSTSANIVFQYNAKNVYFVASSQTGVPIKIFQDGKLINTLTVKDNKLYTLVQNSDYGQHTLQIEVDGAGLQAFTFTFG
jgi:thiol-disulfide isomerase/thioredoxin